MDLSRRDFLKATSAVAAALGLETSGLLTREALAAEGATPVIWLQGSGCTGCSVSFLNTIYYATIDSLLTKTIDLNYHPTVMAAAGDQAVKALTDTAATKGYVLVIEGAIPTADGGKACYAWSGKTMLDAVNQVAPNAGFILAVGSCAAFGGMAAGAPNPTAAKSVKAVTGLSVINIPGCPAHPDWVVGTIAYIQKYGKTPTLDSSGRPTDYFTSTVHSACPLRDAYDDGRASVLGVGGCLRNLGCRGPETRSDCPTRKWNSEAANTPGVAFCTTSGAPCHGCTESTFPDSMSPFYKGMPTSNVTNPLPSAGGSTGGTGGSTGGTGGSTGGSGGSTGGTGGSTGGSGGSTGGSGGSTGGSGGGKRGSGNDDKWTEQGSSGGWTGFTGDDGATSKPAKHPSRKAREARSNSRSDD